MKSCAHKTHVDHQTGEILKGRPFWRCSGCGKVGVWTDSWSYFGSIECPRCWTADMEWVACSDACREKCSRYVKPNEANHGSASQKRNARTERPERCRRDSSERRAPPTAPDWPAAYGALVETPHDLQSSSIDTTTRQGEIGQ